MARQEYLIPARAELILYCLDRRSPVSLDAAHDAVNDNSQYQPEAHLLMIGC
jgi:hypothetical protein